MLKTERLILRKWTEADADSLYEYVKNPAVGPIAGWPPHKSRAESLDVIRNVFCGAECYATDMVVLNNVYIVVDNHNSKNI